MQSGNKSKATYYARHKETRLAYQQWYNKVHRLGRRKMSKDDVEMWTGWKARELKENLPPFENKIVCKARDLEWIPLQMRDVEQRERNRLIKLRDDLSDQYEAEGADVWVPIYVETVSKLLDDIVREAYTYRALYGNPKQGPDPTRMALQGYRRRIAVHHELVDLHKQGPGEEAYWHAYRQGDLVLLGRRVNKTVFKRFYDF